MKWHRQIFAWHSWLGLISGLFVLIFFISGAVILFHHELESWENPHLVEVTPAGNRLPYDSIYRSVRQQAPGLYLYSFRSLPHAPHETIEMRVYDPADRTYPLLYVNPYSGKVLGVKRNSIYEFFMRMHYTFYMGRIGELLAGVFALCLLGSILTGTIVYRKHIADVFLLRMRMKWNNWRTISSSLHRSIGVWALFFNAIMAFSGFYMMLYAFDLKAQFGSASSSAPQTPPPITVNIDTLIQQAQRHIPGIDVRYVDFPRVDQAPIKVQGDLPGDWLFGETNNFVAFSSDRYEVEQVFREDELSGKEKFEYSLYTLHFGEYGGYGIKLLYAFFALAGAILTVTGFLLWYRKKRK